MREKLAIFLVLFLVNKVYGQFSLYLDSEIPVSTQKVSSLKLSNNGRFLGYGDKKGKAYVWDISAKRLVHELKFHGKQINYLLFDSQNQRLVSGSDDKKIVVWDLYSGKIEKVIEGFKSQIRCMELSPDDKILSTGGDRNEIYLWEFPLGSLKGQLKGHKKGVIALSFNANGDQLLSVGKDKLMIVWDPGRQRMIRKTEIEPVTLKNSGIDVLSADFSSDKYFVGIGIQERVLAKGGRRMIFKYNLAFYDWQTGSEIETIEGNKRDIEVLAITPDKNYVVTDNSTLRQNQISFWNIKRGIIEQDYPIEGEITAVDVSEDGKWLAVAYTKNKGYSQSFVNIWQLSGIEGYERFSSKQDLRSSAATGFGSAIRLTTPDEPLIEFGERKRIAVMYFDGPGLDENISRTTTYLLEGKLGNSPFVDLIERNHIEKVLSELKYQMSGLTKSSAVEVGKHLNAKYILIGSVNKLGGLLIITAKLVNVETSQIVGTREVQSSNATIEDISVMVSVLAPTIAKF